MAQLARLDRTAPPMTVAGFEAFLDGAADPRRYELVGGFVVAMANPTETHNQIAANIGAALKVAMDRRRCRTYLSDMRVQKSDRSSESDQFRPDVVVRYGPHTGATFITAPVVVVEVLSPSTIDIDCGLKLAFYKSLKTTRHIALVYQDQMRIEHYRRIGDAWDLEVLRAPEDLVSFNAVAFQISLADAYFDLSV